MLCLGDTVDIIHFHYVESYAYPKVLRAKKRPKTRYEYNIERVRDFKVGKDQDEERMGKVNVLEYEKTQY